MSGRAWWLAAVATLVVAPVVAAGIGMAVLDPNDYKPEIIEAVRNATGRTLDLRGPLRISRSLWPSIEVSDVTLANLPGGTRADMARAERIEAELSLPALLWRRIEVVKLTLVGPNILFEQVGGNSNWVFSRPGEPSVGRADASAPPFSLRIRNVHVQNGMVTTRLPARTNVVGIRALDLRHSRDDGPLDLDAVLVYSDNQPFSLRASAQPTAGLTGPWATRLRFAAFDMTASAEGTMDLAGGYDLRVEAKAGALEKLNALLPDMRLPALREATLSTHLANGPVPGDLPTIGDTRLRFAGADLNDRVPGLALGMTEVSWPAAGGTATLASVGRLAPGQSFTAGGTFGVPLRPDGRVRLPMDLAIKFASSKGKEAPAGIGSLDLKGELTLDTLRFDGLDTTAALRAPALAAFRPALARSLPALTDVRFDGRLAIPPKAGSVSFKGARLVSHEGDIAGDGTIGGGAGLALDAKLHAARLDLDAMLEAFGMGLAAAPATGGNTGPMNPDTPLPWAALRGPSINLSGDIDAMTFQGQAWRKVELALRLKEGRMQVGPARLALPEGPLEVSLTADASGNAVPVSLTMHAPGFPLALIARYADVPGQVSGTVRIDARLRGMGQSARDLAASLDGPFSLTAMGGRLSNAAFAKLASASLDALGIKAPDQGETEIRCLGLVGSFSKGVGRFRTVALDTTYLQMDGAGEVDLGRETVAFKLRPLARISGSAVSVPVLVEGPFRAVRGRLDADNLDKLGLLIDAWLGGDRPDTCSDAGLAPARPPKP